MKAKNLKKEVKIEKSFYDSNILLPFFILDKLFASSLCLAPFGGQITTETTFGINTKDLHFDLKQG